MPKKFGDLFRTEPRHWGLRGDEYLWRELRERFSTTEMPSDLAGAHRLLESSFWEVTGQSLAFFDEFFIERYAHGGMSSGWISGDFWRERGFPEIIERLKAIIES